MTQRNQDNVRELRPLDGRVPPNNLEAEGVVLSALLIQDGDAAFDRVAPILKKEHFYSNANMVIYEAICDLQNSGKNVDLVSVATVLKDKQKLDLIGGTPYLHQLANSIPAVGAALEQHARAVLEKYRMRSLISITQLATAEAYGDVGEPQEWIEQVESQIASLAHDYAERRAATVSQIAFDEVNKLYAASQETDGIVGTSTGFKDLDQLLSGLHDGDLTIIAGRPGMGKTAFLTDLLLNLCRPKEPRDGEAPELPEASLLFALEMPREQMAMRIICGEAAVSYNQIRKGIFMEGDYDALLAAIGVFQRIPFFIDDTPAITLLDMQAQCRKLQREIEQGRSPIPASRLGAVGVDYIQLMGADMEIRRRGSREQEVSSFSRGLKALAKRILVKMLADSQLNRQVEQRGQSKRPGMSDLRESGAIEQDADNIMFLYRESYYDPQSQDKSCEVIVSKQRNGPTGTVKLYFDNKTTRFRNYSNDFDPDEFDAENPYS